MTFPRTDWPKRTDASFRLRVDIDHHQTDSPLEDLPINMIDDIIISDSLHLIDLGIVKRFLKGWTQGTFKNKRGKWSGSDMENINKFLLQCRMPKEIHRAVRGLDCLSHWKGLEYRTFFYYISIAVLKDNLPFELYEHFLLLYCAITICSSNVYHSALKVAKQMLNDFIEHYIENYGQGSITSNVHNLCHVVDEVEKFGNLTTLNAYPFENTLHHIKLLLRQGKNPLPQVARRIHELNKTNNFNQQQGNKFPILKNLNNIGFYRKVEIMDGLYLSDEMHNRWILTKNNEIVGMQGVKMIDDKLQISGCALKSLKNYFEAPIYSSYLNIYLSNCEAKCPPSIYYISDIKCKLVRLSCANNESLFIPLVHTLDLCNQN